MMRILFVNPNSTASMTGKICATARAVAAPDVEVTAWTSHGGPPAIQGRGDGEAAIAPLLDEIGRGVVEGFDAFVIACFDDTGLAEARTLTPKPVIGIGQSAFHAAAMRGTRFSVVTTLAVSVPVIEENLVAAGLDRVCRRVRASGVPVLALETDPAPSERAISAEIGRAISEDGIGAVVLGCAGMADLAARLSIAHGLPVIDGVAAACGLARTLVTLK
ncbi:MAG: aspartate/glutamate racemase family protein [Pseudomonadota bacterium]